MVEYDEEASRERRVAVKRIGRRPGTLWLLALLVVAAVTIVLLLIRFMSTGETATPGGNEVFPSPTSEQ